MGGGNGREELLMSPETIERIRIIHELLEEIVPALKVDVPQIKVMLTTMVTAQTSMAASAAMMASTNDKAEQRYAKLEERLQAVNDRAAGKGQIPIWSHFITIGGILFISVLVILYVNQQNLKASLTSVEVQHGK